LSNLDAKQRPTVRRLILICIHMVYFQTMLASENVGRTFHSPDMVLTDTSENGSPLY
jgi:hypothetical protein